MEQYMFRCTAVRLLVWFCVALSIAAFIEGIFDRTNVLIAQAQDDEEAIAYVLPNDETGDEIHLIAPDGSNDRRIWQVGKPDEAEVESIGTLAWRADGAEIAFDSDHEGYCSLWESDIYAIRADGSGYRRVTHSPACAELANYPKGTVHVPIRNFNLDSSIYFLYVQGAPSVQMVTLGAGQGTTVTFEDVADFGEGQLQWAIAAGGPGRWFDAAVTADVQAGGEVATPLLTVSGTALPDFGASTPDWRSDGSELAYSFGFGTLYRIADEPGVLEIGEPLLQEGTDAPLFSYLPRWGPTEATADQVLYWGGVGTGDSSGIYLTTAGSDKAGAQLVAFELFELIFGLEWLPDGSGFVFAASEDFLRRANLFLYEFASGETTRLTGFTDEFAGALSVSPDGQQIVFERAVSQTDYMLDFVDHEVWIVNRDGTGLRRLVENGRSPAWRPRATAGTPSSSRFALPDWNLQAMFCNVARGMKQRGVPFTSTPAFCD